MNRIMRRGDQVRQHNASAGAAIIPDDDKPLTEAEAREAWAACAGSAEGRHASRAESPRAEQLTRLLHGRSRGFAGLLGRERLHSRLHRGQVWQVGEPPILVASPGAQPSGTSVRA